MKRILIVLLCSIFAIYLLIAQENKENPQPTPADKPLTKYTKEFALSLLKGVDDSMYPKIFKAKMSMETIRKGRNPIKFVYEVYSKGGTKALMEIVYPARDKGKKILLLDNNLWMYVPDVSRPIRLSRNQSFMGSTFSNEDVSDVTWEDDYDPLITGEKGEMLLLTLKAKRKDVAYKQIDIWVNKETRVPTEGVYYGLSGKPIKKVFFSNVKEIAGLLRPLDMRMIDLLEQGAYTDVKVLELQELETLPDYKFDASQLGR
ncbi:MAG: outer membrane lipoprotein-sorting protein [Candidatus Goldbacteria bacterium]|nr:outer membrane lipoprotein-sorting protein [Candidatus Goldiibacteriota bacterium]